MTAPGAVVRSAAARRSAAPPRWTAAVAPDEQGRPQVALTLVLDRRPAIDEPDLLPLVARGLFAVTVALRPPPPTPPTGGPGGAGFVQAGVVRLVHDGAADPLATAEVVGSQPTAVLGAAVRGDVAAALLRALDGTMPGGVASGLAVEHEIELRGEPARAVVRLAGRWPLVWDLLAARADDAGRLRADDLAAACRRAITTGSVRVAVDGGPGAAPDVPEVAVDLLVGAAGFLVEVLPAGGLSLRRRPSDLMPLTVAEEVVVPTRVVVVGRTSVEELLAGALDPEDRERVVRLVALDPGVDAGAPVVPVGRLTRSTSRARARADVALLAKDNRFTAVPLVLDGEAGVNAQVAATAYESLTTQPGRWQAMVVGPALYVDDSTTPQPGPIVPAGDEAVLVDRLDPGRRWYVPTFRLRRPATGQAPATSPFLFSFATLGVASGPVPTVGLDATIRVTVEPVMSEATRQALEALGNPPVDPVPVVGLEAALEVPYRVEGSPQTQFHTLTGELVPADAGGYTLTVRALDQIARLSYGALSTDGFQAQPPAVVVRFSFDGWAREQRTSVQVVGALRDRSRFGLKNTATELTGFPFAKVTKPTIKTLPATFEPIWTVPPAAWTSRSVGRAERVPAVLGCADHPELYRQTSGGTDRAIGCQEALRLGESAPPAYAEVTEAAAPTHRVLRSLQQPGRFVVLPASFRITRGGPDAGDRAFRPSILIHAAIGGTGGDRYVFMATLAPAIELTAWRALVRLLRTLCPPDTEPQVQLPLDPTIQAQLAYRWSLPTEVAEPVVTRTWDGFQVAVSTELAAGLLLNNLIETSGLTGEVEVALPGGLTVTSALVLDTDVVGPWGASPLTVTATGTTATVTNHTERTADVLELVTPGGTVGATLDQAVPPGQAVTVPLTGPGDGLAAVYQLRRGALGIEQLSAYISDVTTRLSVVNLVSYANHGLVRLDVDVRTADGALHECAIEERGEAEVTLTFPLTAYLAARVVSVRVRRLHTDGRSAATDWSTWDLATAGTVLSLTSELIGIEPPAPS